jgi:hypothetical protein
MAGALLQAFVGHVAALYIGRAAAGAAEGLMLTVFVGAAEIAAK